MKPYLGNNPQLTHVETIGALLCDNGTAGICEQYPPMSTGTSARDGMRPNFSQS